MKRLLFAGALLASLLLVVAPARAQQTGTELHFFYGQGCPHCARMAAFLENMIEQYPGLNVSAHEVYFDADERDLFLRMADAYGARAGAVPTVFIDDKAFIGYDDDIAADLERKIRACNDGNCVSPMEVLSRSLQNDIVSLPVILNDLDATDNPAPTNETSDSNPGTTTSLEGEKAPSDVTASADAGTNGLLGKLTIPAVLSASLVDAVNPCAFAVLVILLTTVLASGSRRKGLLAGLAFSISVFISYFLMGLGLYSAIDATGVSRTFYAVMASLAILLGLFNLKDSFWYGKWFIMEVPMSWRPTLKALIRSVTSVPGAFLIGFAVSLFLLPCTSGPYVVILGLLAHAATHQTAVAYLLLYNFIFVLPMIAITVAVYFGMTSADKIEAWRTARLKTLHLIAGALLFMLGIGMFIAMAAELI